jgi:hypothetical protein
VHLIGNAREWTLSLFDRDQSQSWDGKDEKVQLIILGGSYFSPIIRLSQSFPVDPSWPDSETGFRCVSPISTRRTTK